MGKKQVYRNLDALEPIKKILGEADEALNDESRTIETSEMPEILGAIAGGAVGVGAGLTLVYVAGISGLSAVGITSGLATLGSIIGGGMVVGIFVAGAPMAVLGIGGYALLSHRNKKKLKQAKEALLQETLRKYDAIIRELNRKINLSEERAKYLDALNVLLQQIIKDLEADLGTDKAA
ncbi:MAG: hypothetical protein B6I36_10300 [Desulfobacteraceae bacterium 4572_35.1]|nr:MAG: hypothetical protein B6I36_10300 [Desulfobacteraceae bacterium 4572_35.1]